MPTLLVSGFDAWGDLEENPSWLAVDAATPNLPPDWEIRKVRLPVSWDQAFEQLLASWSDDVGASIAFGVAPIQGVALEQIAINLSEGSDVDGRQPPSKEVIPDAPAAYWSTLPIDPLHTALTDAGLPTVRSAHAGTFLCNALFYQMVHHALWTKPEAPCGFIHLSNLRHPEAVSLDDLTQAVTVCAETVVTSPA